VILALLIALLFVGGVAAGVAGRWRPAAARWISLAALGADLVLAASFLGLRTAAGDEWILEVSWPWIPRFGASIHLGLDGLSLPLVLLTLVLGLVSVLVSWKEVTRHVGFFHFNLLFVLAGVLGVFLSLDLLLFYFFWELMLVPMYLLIAIWGHEGRLRAAVQFFLFTQASGLLMLISILGLVFVHAQGGGTWTFDYEVLLGTSFSPTVGLWLLLGFLAAFAVKLPAVPLHTWLPDAHAEAPTAGSIVLAGLLLKTGGYGLLRLGLPLFPDASRVVAPVALTLGVVGILYGALLAFAQTDLKRMVAYTSVSHMGFVLVGVYAGTTIALNGALFQMICHGLSTGGLFAVAGLLQERLHTRELERMGGLWQHAPRLGGLTLVLALASLGLPGLGNFVAEFLVLFGAFRGWPAVASVAALGLVAAAVYSLWLVQRVFYGTQSEKAPVADVSPREAFVLATLVAGLLWLGIRPQPLLDGARPALEAVHAPAPAPQPSPPEVVAR
jgi:NADH-quinone oxidoreductase subunit M